MSRSLLACIGACCLIAAAGCRMCAHPYDECGPMSGGGCSQGCGSSVRAGSIMSGESASAVDAGEVSDQTISPADNAMEPARQPRKPARAEAAPAEGWKASKPLESPKGGSY